MDGFLRTDMDVLALGPWVVRKEGAGAAASGRTGRAAEHDHRAE